MLLKIKVHKSFLKGQFLIEGQDKAYRIDQNGHGGVKILFIKEDIPSNLLSMEKLLIEGTYE